MSPRDLGNSVRQKSRAFRPPARTWENSVRQKSRVFRPPRGPGKILSARNHVFSPPREDGPGKILSPQNHVTWSRQATEAWLPTRQCELARLYTPALDAPLRVFCSKREPGKFCAQENTSLSAMHSRQGPDKILSAKKNLTFTHPRKRRGNVSLYVYLYICLALYML